LLAVLATTYLEALAGCGATAVPVASSSPVADSGAGAADATLDAAAAVTPDAAFVQRVDDAGGGILLGCTGDPPVMKYLDQQTNTELNPDWGCYADAGALADAGSAVPARRVTFHLGPYPGVYDGVTADFFFGWSTLGAAAVTRVFANDSDAVTFDVPAGRDVVSAWIHALQADSSALSIEESREYGFAVPAGDASIEASGTIHDMRALTVNLVLEGGREDPAKSLLIADARDCLGRYVGGAQFELVDGETNLPVPTRTAPGAPVTGYWYFALPNAGCDYTGSELAQWVMVDAPVNVTGDATTHSYRFRLKGRMHASDPAPVVLGEREIELFAGAITFVRLYR
jgi:hypothetical protein